MERSGLALVSYPEMAGSHLSISYGLSLLPVHYELFMRQFAQFHTGWPLCCCLLTTRRVAEPRDKMALPCLSFGHDNELVVLPQYNTLTLWEREQDPKLDEENASSISSPAPPNAPGVL